MPKLTLELCDLKQIKLCFQSQWFSNLKRSSYRISINRVKKGSCLTHKKKVIHGFLWKWINSSVRKGKVNSETRNGSMSNLFCVLLLLLPRWHCVHCDLARVPLCCVDRERCWEVLHRPCYDNQAAASGWGILCLDPKQEVIILVKEKRINLLSQGHTSRNTHRIQKVRWNCSGNETGSRVQWGDTILQIVSETDHKYSTIGVQGPKKWSLSISMPEIWGQNSHRIQVAHKMQG